MDIPDPRAYAPEARAKAAWLAHEAVNVDFPPGLPAWNYALVPRRHQRTGIAWLYWMPRALLADQGGLGKTVQVAGLLALLQADGELGNGQRQRGSTDPEAAAPALLVVRAASMAQWRSELARFTPGLRVITLDGGVRERAGVLLGSPWEVALISPEMLASKITRAARQLDEFRFSLLVCDDVESLKNENKTSKVIGRLAAGVPRMVVSTATPLDKRLTQLYDTGVPLGWPVVLGRRPEFQRHYVRTEKTWYTPRLKPSRCRLCQCVLIADWKQRAWTDEQHQRGPCPRNTGRPHVPLRQIPLEPRYREIETGAVPENLAEFRARIAPLVLRRTDADVDDAEIPGVQLTRVWLDLLPGQAERYEEIRKGVLKMAGRKVSQREAENLWLRAWQVTSSLATLDGQSPARGTQSVKVNRAVDDATGDLADEPVVIYSYFKPTITLLERSLTAAGASVSRLWGDDSPRDREGALAAWDAGHTRVMLITDAGGMGLNLQRSRRLILVDTPRSASRLAQVIWRLRRDGSEHATVWVTQLLTRTPLEEALAARNVAEAAMSAAVLDGAELDPMFGGQLTSDELLREVTGVSD